MEAAGLKLGEESDAIAEDLERLIRDTVTTYGPADVRVAEITSLPLWPHERGWSGAEVRRYHVRLQGAGPITLITKTVPRAERQVMALLSAQGHLNVPWPGMVG